ncbi:interleukin-10 [Myripristis murdjan]|uniref:interleukin-10 n=1 Tax=Myripristis murdjan TaxID=586833 RepID=UPI0011762F80|nr:interleukin-10 [Myripristis murdjan]
MSPPALLLSIITALSLLGRVWNNSVCNNDCCRFVEGFPVRLRELRQHFSHIRDYYEANDDLDTALLDQNVLNYFNSPYGCHAMNSLLDFYLRTVLPGALAAVTEENKHFKHRVESIQQIFDELKRDVIKCRNYFSCQRPFDIKDFNSTYTEMESKGLYKAMGELDLFFNYIETYLASKRQTQ